MTTQFTKLTLEEAKELHSMGVINTTTLVLLYFRIRLAQGWKTKLINRELAEELRIPESSFYRAISYLRTQGLLFFRTKGLTEYALDPDTLYNENKNVSKSNHRDSLPINERLTPTNERLSPINEKIGCPKPASDKEHSDAPDYLQILFKSLSPFLQERGVSDEKIFSFLDWWINQGMSELGFKINKPVAYLMSIDAISGEKRILLHFAHWEAQLINSAKPQETSANQEWEKVLALSSQMSWGQKSEEIIKEPKLLKAVMDAGGLWKIAQAEFKDLKALKARFIMSWNEEKVVRGSGEVESREAVVGKESSTSHSEDNLITAEQLAELKLKLQNIGLKL